MWYVWYMGKRTSVYLSDELAAGVAASGAGLAELVRRGLGAALPGGVPPVPPPLQVVEEAIVTVERSPRKARVRKAGPGGPAAAAGCKHLRAVKGWCKDCGSGGHL